MNQKHYRTHTYTHTHKTMLEASPALVCGAGVVGGGFKLHEEPVSVGRGEREGETTVLARQV